MRFQHTRLDNAGRSVRVIQVLPLREEGLIECTMTHLKRDLLTKHLSKPYSALSYMWGDPQNQHHIKINGADFEVRENLYGFLTCAQKSRTHQNLWIDALCIDQTDTEERNQQVQQMGRIYKDAASVLIYLHVSLINPAAIFQYPHLSKALTDALKDLHSFWEYRESKYSFNGVEHTGPKRGIHEFHESIAAAEKWRKDNFEAETDIRALADNDYWSRVWILQEVRLANRDAMLVVCKNAEMSFETYSQIRFNDCGHDHDRPYNPIDPCPYISICGEEYRGFSDMGLPLQVSNIGLRLQVCREVSKDRKMAAKARDAAYELTHLLPKDHKCSDLRDRVFGILALYNWGSTIAVDYSMDCLQLYRYVLLHISRLSSKWIWTSCAYYHWDRQMKDLSVELAMALELAGKPLGLLSSDPFHVDHFTSKHWLDDLHEKESRRMKAWDKGWRYDDYADGIDERGWLGVGRFRSYPECHGPVKSIALTGSPTPET
jgi:hypothetical protein